MTVRSVSFQIGDDFEIEIVNNRLRAVVQPSDLQHRNKMRHDTGGGDVAEMQGRRRSIPDRNIRKSGLLRSGRTIHR